MTTATLQPPDNADLALLERLRAAADLLEAVAADRALLERLPADDRQRLHQAVARVYHPDPIARRQQLKAAERARNTAQIRSDDALLNQTGIRALRRKPVFTTPNVFPPEGFEPHGVDMDEAQPHESIEPQHCYVCKQKYSVIHPFYDQLCPACAVFNFAKRTELADLRGRVALLTGGRVKIGYQAGLKLLRAWALALGANEDVFDATFEKDPSTLIKIVRYPGKSDPTPKQGVGAHKDSGVLTLLFVEPGKGGLQVEKDGEWIDAPPIPGAFVVNIGELLEVATDGYLKATVHRVISPIIGSDRISIPFFFNPALDASIPTLELPTEFQAEAAGITADPANPIFRTYGENVLKSRLRAHPDVAAIHHPDLAGTPPQ